jgi:predicted alpha/beta hydrolase family esterase
MGCRMPASGIWRWFARWLHESRVGPRYGRPVRVVVVPRWGGTPSDDWYQWAAAELAGDGVRLSALDVPEPSEPAIGAWVDATAAALAEEPAAETVLVGHSVGCRAALRAAELQPAGTRLRGLLLVAGWWEVDEPWDTLLEWQELEHDAARIRDAAGRPMVLLSDDDPFTRDWAANRRAWIERLGADVRVHVGCRHFNATEEPSVLAAIDELLASDGRVPRSA